ncbi:hypothetical protein [Halomicronema sp. CCY15110]|uniref:hypothetical protein n=1 Tax=Halomicronema sp. CCY15110 TaxID=2767773 RepID=UPI0019503FEE|nr:hypothetical protein [Halomicronema sp. CCY15110]
MPPWVATGIFGSFKESSKRSPHPDDARAVYGRSSTVHPGQGAIASCSLSESGTFRWIPRSAAQPL